MSDIGDPDPNEPPVPAGALSTAGGDPAATRASLGALSQAAPANRAAAKAALDAKTQQDIAAIEDTIKAIRASREGQVNLPMLAFGAGMLRGTPGVASNFGSEISSGLQAAIPAIAAGRQTDMANLRTIGGLQEKIGELRRKPAEEELQFQDKLSIEATKLIAQMDAAGLRSNRPIQVPTTGEVVFPNHFGPGKHGFSSPNEPGVIKPYGGVTSATPTTTPVPTTTPQYDPNDPIPFLQKTVHPDIKPGVWSGGDPKWDELAKIAQTDPEYAQKLWKVLNYELDPTKVTDMRKGKDIGPHSFNRYVADAMRIDPNWNPGGYESVKKGRESWMGTAQNAKTTVALQTGINHVGELMHAAAAMENGDTQALNRLKNWAAAQRGEAAPAEFSASVKFVGDEIAKFLSGSGVVAEGSKEEIASIFSGVQSPAQLQGVVRKVVGLLEGKTKPMADQKTLDFGNRRRFTFEDLLGDSKHVVEKVMKYDITTPEGQKAWGVTPKEKTWPAPNAAAVQRLRTTKDIDQFNAIFGPGAAEKILGGG